MDTEPAVRQTRSERDVFGTAGRPSIAYARLAVAAVVPGLILVGTARIAGIELLGIRPYELIATPYLSEWAVFTGTVLAVLAAVAVAAHAGRTDDPIGGYLRIAGAGTALAMVGAGLVGLTMTGTLMTAVLLLGLVALVALIVSGAVIADFVIAAEGRSRTPSLPR